MNLLFVGDVVGKSGCDFLASKISQIKRDEKIDITVINGENSAQGNGLTVASLDRLINMGADAVTTGNHCFRRKEIMESYDSCEILVRPANYPDGVVGRGVTVLDFGRCRVAVVNLQGTIFMDALDNPFTVIDRVLADIDTPNIILDFHAEATSEKKAMGHYLTGRVTAVLGTHTHVQTADAAILGGHTAYITDVGMTGAEMSALGVKSELIIEKLRFHCPVKFEESENPCFINCVVVSFDEKTGKAYNIKPMQIR